jgi:hypothetical protein
VNVPSIADLDLTSELARLRGLIPPGTRQVLNPEQGFGLREVKTTRDAVDLLLVSAIVLLTEIPAAELTAEHPAIGALATVLAHPEAERKYFDDLGPEKKAKVEALLGQRKASWSPQKLEWQWVQFVATFTDERVDPRRSLQGQLFESSALQSAWSALMNLEVLRAWGLLGEAA